MPPAALTTYQLHIRVAAAVEVSVGRLGRFRFAAGDYVYTGSARRNLEARIARHLRQDKTLRWHIDHLLAAKGVSVLSVSRHAAEECALNQATPGDIPVPGFGASDCRAGCGAHLKRLHGGSRDETGNPGGRPLAAAAGTDGKGAGGAEPAAAG